VQGSNTSCQFLLVSVFPIVAAKLLAMALKMHDIVISKAEYVAWIWNV
jgi:hypothetical protein